MIYNSALKNGTQQFKGLPPTNRFEQDGCVGLRRNLITEGYFKDLESCDVIYCEPPFPAGVKVFDQRAKENTNSYTDFANGFSRIWNLLEHKPRLAITNKRLEKFITKPDLQVKVKLNTHWETLSCWGVSIPEGKTNLEICQILGNKYTRIGDFTCGYGIPILSFKKARQGNTFVGADYDAHCITVLRMLMNEDIHE